MTKVSSLDDRDWLQAQSLEVGVTKDFKAIAIVAVLEHEAIGKVGVAHLIRSRESAEKIIEAIQAAIDMHWPTS